MADEEQWNGDLYWNKHDTRFLVPKRNPWLGWTINLAHPFSEPALVALLVLPLAVIAAFAAKRS